MQNAIFFRACSAIQVQIPKCYRYGAIYKGKIPTFSYRRNEYLNIMRTAGEKFFSNLQGIYVEFEALANIEHDFHDFRKFRFLLLVSNLPKFSSSYY